MRCDIIAEGIIAAARELDLSMPVVVRLQGKQKVIWTNSMFLDQTYRTENNLVDKYFECFWG